MTEIERAERDRLLATRSVKALWDAGYRAHPVSKEWLPREEVVKAVALRDAALGKNDRR